MGVCRRWLPDCLPAQALDVPVVQIFVGEIWGRRIGTIIVAAFPVEMATLYRLGI